jgi:Ser/Thr protein kinase RdoA (MazF antagonist)
VNKPLAPYLALAVREVQWLESLKGQQLFDVWRSTRHPAEDRTMTLPAFLEPARTLAADIIPHMYALFPLPEIACRPALSHPDFHSSNILVSHDNPAHITGVVDWEFASILPLWAAYTIPPGLVTMGTSTSATRYGARRRSG